MVSPSKIRERFKKRSAATDAEPSGPPKKKRITSGPPRHNQHPREEPDNPPMQSTSHHSSATISEPIAEIRTRETRAPTPPINRSSPNTSASNSDEHRPRADPQPQRERRRKNQYDSTIQVGPNDSAFNDPELARRLIKMLVLPRDAGERESRTIEEVLPSAYTSIIALAHDTLAMDRRIMSYREATRAQTDQLTAANAEKQKALDMVETLVNRENKYCDEISRLKEEKDRLIREKEYEKSAGNEVRRLLQTAQFDLAMARTACEKGDASVKSAKAEVHAHRMDAQAARREADSARKSAQEAIQNFKASADFEAELMKASDEFYITGFGDCKKEVQQHFPNIDLSIILDPEIRSADSQSDDTEENHPTELPSDNIAPIENISVAPAEEDSTETLAGGDVGVEAIIDQIIVDLTEEVPIVEGPTADPIEETLIAEEQNVDPTIEVPIAEEPNTDPTEEAPTGIIPIERNPNEDAQTEDHVHSEV